MDACIYTIFILYLKCGLTMQNFSGIEIPEEQAVKLNERYFFQSTGRSFTSYISYLVIICNILFAMDRRTGRPPPGPGFCLLDKMFCGVPGWPLQERKAGL